MDIKQAMRERHSVRSYTDKPIEGKTREKLEVYIERCNRERGLHMQLVLNEPDAFSGRMARYGRFSDVKNYIVLAGSKRADLDERIGYYGEKVVLYAQMLGLNTCWVALTYNKSKTSVQLRDDEKMVLVLAIGYGSTQGVPHKSKQRNQVMRVQGTPPQWFLDGVDAALLAPTAVNQQKFIFILDENRVQAKAGMGFYTGIDLGIVKYHFELGAGKENFTWKS